MDYRAQRCAANASPQDDEVLATHPLQRKAVAQWTPDAHDRAWLKGVENGCHRAHPVDSKFQVRGPFHCGRQAKWSFPHAKGRDEGELPWLVIEMRSIQPDLK